MNNLACSHCGSAEHSIASCSEHGISRINTILQEDVPPTLEESRELYTCLRKVVRRTILDTPNGSEFANNLLKKVFDITIRSAPTESHSSEVAGGPQSGDDGNRRSRWEYEEDHPYYATETTSILTFCRFLLQFFCISGAPELPSELNCDGLANLLLIEGGISPGTHTDPISLEQVGSWNELRTSEGRRGFELGHFTPYARGGRHTLENAFLQTIQSNRIQGNNTLDELIEWAISFLENHSAND